jgi:hypothetical protein
VAARLWGFESLAEHHCRYGFLDFAAKNKHFGSRIPITRLLCHDNQCLESVLLRRKVARICPGTSLRPRRTLHSIAPDPYWFHISRVVPRVRRPFSNIFCRRMRLQVEKTCKGLVR